MRILERGHCGCFHRTKRHCEVDFVLLLLAKCQQVPEKPCFRTVSPRFLRHHLEIFGLPLLPRIHPDRRCSCSQKATTRINGEARSWFGSWLKARSIEMCMTSNNTGISLCRGLIGQRIFCVERSGSEVYSHCTPQS